jgi:hypothetical protein
MHTVAVVAELPILLQVELQVRQVEVLTLVAVVAVLPQRPVEMT